MVPTVRYTAILCALAALACASCEYGLHEAFWRSNAVDVRAAQMAEVSEPDTLGGAQQYAVVIITDTHYGKGYEPLDDRFIASLKKQPNVKFVISLGDCVDHGLGTEVAQYAAFIERIKVECGLPVYSVVGNHDLYNSGWSKWQEQVAARHAYTSCYHFTTNDTFSWYFLDNASGTFGRKQLAVMKEKMETDTRPKFVFAHIPLYSQLDRGSYFSLQNEREGNQVISLFARTNVRMMCAGHTHRNEQNDLGKLKLYTIGTFMKSRMAMLHVDESADTVTVQYVKIK
ncbi:MAG: metallophosphoesterase [Treponema sp.]|nr:metallophosphoesterase [Treponema sp.]